LGQEIATRVDEWGFIREDGIRCVNAFIVIIRDAIQASPGHGEFLIPGFGKLRWHRYRGKWIEKTPRVYVKIKMVTYQKNKFFDRSVARLVKELYNTPWFVGEEARLSMKGGNPYGSSIDSGCGRAGSI
jgi:hypothetical protein